MILKHDGWTVKTTAEEGLKLEKVIRNFGTVYIDDRNPDADMERTRVWTRKFIVFLNPDVGNNLKQIDDLEAFFYQDKFYNAILKLTYDYRGEQPTCTVIVKEGDIQILGHNLWHCSQGHRLEVKVWPPVAGGYLVLCPQCAKPMQLKREALFPGLRNRLRIMEKAYEEINQETGVSPATGKA